MAITVESNGCCRRGSHPKMGGGVRGGSELKRTVDPSYFVTKKGGEVRTGSYLKGGEVRRGSVTKGRNTEFTSYYHFQ